MQGIFKMLTNIVARRLSALALLAGLALSALTGCGQSGPTYDFSVVRDEIAMGGDALIDVKLTKAGSSEPVADAVIFETRFDMEPDGMGAMDAPVKVDGSPMPGTYRFIVRPTMAGRWALKLGVKVQGEADSVRGQVIVTAR
jgi:hypothetical protein